MVDRFVHPNVDRYALFELRDGRTHGGLTGILWLGRREAKLTGKTKHRWLVSFAAVTSSLWLGTVTLADDTTVIDRVNVLTMTSEHVLKMQRVVVEGGVIQAVGDVGAAEIPESARTIDGNGRYLMPGLSDMHAHITGYSGEGGITESQEIAENQLLLYLSTGVALLRDVSGTPGHFDYQRQLESGQIKGSDLYFTSPVIGGENFVWPFSFKMTDAADADKVIGDFSRQGYWGVKIYHTISRDVFDAIIAASKRHEIPVIGHVPFDVGIEMALRRGNIP